MTLGKWVQMGPSPFLSVIHTVTTGTMLNFNGGKNGHELKIVTCKQTLIICSVIINLHQSDKHVIIAQCYVHQTQILIWNKYEFFNTAAASVNFYLFPFLHQFGELFYFIEQFRLCTEANMDGVGERQPWTDNDDIWETTYMSEIIHLLQCFHGRLKPCSRVTSAFPLMSNLT